MAVILAVSTRGHWHALQRGEARAGGGHGAALVPPHQLVADGYDKCAEAYLGDHAAEDPDDMRQGPFTELLAGLPDGAHVLDAGCGAGVPIAKAVVQDPRQMRVTGVDISPRQIELAKQLVPSDRARFGRAHGMPIASGSGTEIREKSAPYPPPHPTHDHHHRPTRGSF